MSGIAIAWPTIPGSVATFATCSSALSSIAFSRIASDAKIRPGTFIPST
jgi:hypothetical protein